MFLVPNIDQMYKEMKKIVEVRNRNSSCGTVALDGLFILLFLWSSKKNK
jgi:hypothetical protein